MCLDRTKSLLVVLPGRVGRQNVLKQLQSVAKLCVLAPTSGEAASQWAKALVGEDNWIQWEGAYTDSEAAWSAVLDWLNRGGGQRCIAGVMSYDEFGIELCSAIGERLGVPCTPPAEIRSLRSKQLFRERCRAAGLPAARNLPLRCEEDLQAVQVAHSQGTFSFPAVIKPVKGGGSWHVMRVDKFEELVRVYEQLRQALQGSSFPQDVQSAGFTVEEYFAGCEVDVDGWARNGKVEFCMVSDNHPALEPYFLEVGGVYPSQLPRAAVEALEQLTRDVVAAFPGMHTCFHFEAKINPDTLEVMPIEMNARCGGAECPASVKAVTGHYLPEVAARLALGLAIPTADPIYQVVASTNIHVFESGILSECSGDTIDPSKTNLVDYVLFGEVGRMHVPNNGSLSCLGWLASGGATADEAQERLNTAVAQLRIAVTPVQDQVQSAL